MQVTVESPTTVTKKITFEIPSERVDAEIEKTFLAIQKKAKLQGFRPGKAPLALVKRTYQDAMANDVMNNFFRDTLYAAMNEHKIEPVDSPTIECDTLAAGKPFKYSAVVEIMPEILLKEYTGLEITTEKFVLDPAKIEGEINRMRENMAQLIPVDDDSAVVESGNVVVIDYVYSVAGFPLEADAASGVELEVGGQKMLAGFEDQLLGMKCGEQRDVTITLPEGYRNPEAAGKEALFKITLNEIKKKELPELDDEFAQQFGDYETIADLRSKMSEYLEKQERERIELQLKERAVSALIEKNPLEVPSSMVKRQLEYMLENLKNRLKGQQMSMEMMGFDEQGFNQRFTADAEDKVKGGLLLMALVEKEDISVNDADLSERYEQLAAGNADMITRIKEYYAVNKKALAALISEIKEDKAIRLLLDNAVITEADAATEAASEA